MWPPAPFILGLLIGVLLGAGVVALAARRNVRRSIERLRGAERRARAAERLAEVGALTGGLAHEIKNPLSTIGLNAQLLTEGLEELPVDAPVTPEASQRLLRRSASLRREVERLRGILSDFLAFAGELRLDIAPHDLSRVVEELADFFLPQAEHNGVRMRLDLASQPLIAPFDAPLLKQAVLNLLLNAVQAMALGPSSSAAPAPPRELIIRTRPCTEADESKAVQLLVIDTGPGIPADVLPRIFTPYFTTKSGGSGLGLATTRRIVEAHQGRIEVHSEPAKGTSFTITLPAEPAPTAADPA